MVVTEAAPERDASGNVVVQLPHLGSNARRTALVRRGKARVHNMLLSR
jgi:hypothetical protein